MAQINEISSLRTQDPAVARATRPRRFKYVNPPFFLFALLLIGYGLIIQFSATSADADYSLQGSFRVWPLAWCCLSL